MSSTLKGASPYRISLNGPTMMRSGGASRRFGMLLVLAACILSILYLSNLRSPDHTSPRAIVEQKEAQSPATELGTTQIDLTGHVIPPKLGNATLKYGRSLRLQQERANWLSNPGRSSAAQPGNSFIQPLHDFPINLRPKNPRRSAPTSTFSKGCIHAGNAQSTSPMSLRNTRHRCRRGLLLQPGDVTFTTL
jgi:hypothetical protein